MGSYCTMGQVGLSMGVHCPCLGAPYPTVRPIPLYHGTGGTVHGSPLSLLSGSISHCPSYPTVPWDGWDCPWESTVLSEGSISHCPSYPTVPWDGWDCPWESTVLSEGSISHCPSYPTVPWDGWDCSWEYAVPV